ncbi:AraC family transcriptional regulator [Rhizobium sp. BK602]|uniref:AraC family transcriptional regulator n=1 Tax=Rhizobium sp. BK602 TaxID=2586986 RepID=UPI0016157656|nr:AraC family transcriptional regulator [Rhizobium sp. BK602]MBB3610408.1 AraC-like DNA-binding protein [Rhizobium sp. BK602]
MDPLSDVLSLLKPRSYMFGGFEAGGDWSIRFGPHDGIKCYAVVSGQSWLSVEGVPDAVALKAGDCFVLPRGWPFRLASDLSLTPTDYRALFPTRPNGSIAALNGGGDFSIVGGHFTLGGGDAGVLLAMLPPIVHIRKETDRAALRWCMERMRLELREPQPGGFLIAQQLAYTMLVQALRLHLAEGLAGGVGWLFALADRQMAAAITAMHAEPAHRWTLASLAERAGMSRTSFTLKFKETVGTSPMDYLTRWRMMVAGEKLSHSGDPVSTIALSLGYQSESAFSTAFKRIMGCSPREYARRDLPPAMQEEPESAVGQLRSAAG